MLFRSPHTAGRDNATHSRQPTAPIPRDNIEAAAVSHTTSQSRASATPSAPLPHAAAARAAPPALSPAIPTSPAKDKQLSVSDLYKLLEALLPLLASPTTATALHSAGVNSVKRLVALTFSSIEAQEEFVTGLVGLAILQKRVLRAKLEDLRSKLVSG